jgi:hypothetical protein
MAKVLHLGKHNVQREEGRSMGACKEENDTRRCLRPQPKRTRLSPWNLNPVQNKDHNSYKLRQSPIIDQTPAAESRHHVGIPYVTDKSASTHITIIALHPEVFYGIDDQ